MLPRRNLADASRPSTLNPRLFNRLQPLSLPFPTPVLSFQRLAASFPKTPGWGVPRFLFQPPIAHCPLLITHSPLTPFRINTCKSVSKQRTLTCFRINTYEKHREGEGEHQLHRRAAGFFLAMVRRRSAVLCGRREPCFKGHLREPSPRTLRWLDYRKSVGGGLALAQRNSQPLLAHIGPNNRSGHIARLKPAAKIA